MSASVKNSARKAKQIPQRTCVACRASSAKRALVRIVRTPDGSVEVDATGKRSGRGAYLCAKGSCWDEALKKDRLSRALRISISPDVRKELQRYAERFVVPA